MKTLYAGIDLHSNNSQLGILDQNDKRIFHKRLPNMADVILAELEPYKEELSVIVVESTYNWYWLVDCLMDVGYRVLLANPAAMQQYKGLKHVNDKHDSMTNMTPSGWHIWPDLAYCLMGISIPKRTVPFVIC